MELENVVLLTSRRAKSRGRHSKKGMNRHRSHCLLEYDLNEGADFTLLIEWGELRIEGKLTNGARHSMLPLMTIKY